MTNTDAIRPMSDTEKKVIFASSLGTIFEWSDFYLFGVMSAIIAANFFSALDESTRNIFVLLALMVILGTRTYFGEKEFADWAWRVPYALSGILLVISIWIRLKLNESPAFSKMKAEDKTSKAL